MKSLIQKDLFNISHNAKPMVFMLIIFAFIIIPSTDSNGYIVMSTLLCGMMVITSFSFDEHSNWNQYALIMPVSKKDLVAGKYVILFIATMVGSISGFLLASIGGIIFGKINLQANTLLELLFVTLAATMISIISGSTTIALVFQFGAEKGRLLLLLSYLLPATICLAIYKGLLKLGIHITDTFIFSLVCCLPIIALIWSYCMYKISCFIFLRKEV